MTAFVGCKKASFDSQKPLTPAQDELWPGARYCDTANFKKLYDKVDRLEMYLFHRCWGALLKCCPKSMTLLVKSIRGY